MIYFKLYWVNLYRTLNHTDSSSPSEYLPSIGHYFTHTTEFNKNIHNAPLSLRENTLFAFNSWVFIFKLFKSVVYFFRSNCPYKEWNQIRTDSIPNANRHADWAIQIKKPSKYLYHTSFALLAAFAHRDQIIVTLTSENQFKFVLWEIFKTLWHSINLPAKQCIVDIMIVIEKKFSITLKARYFHNQLFSVHDVLVQNIFQFLKNWMKHLNILFLLFPD